MARIPHTRTKALGRVFDSKGEAERAMELTALQQQGKILGLVFQPEFEIQPAFKAGSGKRIRAIKYTADFEYNENGVWVVEDYKGYMTDVARLRHKLFQFWAWKNATVGPGVVFRLTGPAAEGKG